MTRKKWARTISVLTLAFFMGLGMRSAQAGIAVSPLKQEISLKPGEEVDVPLTLSYNNRLPTDMPEKVAMTLQDVQVTEAGALTFKDPSTLANSAAKWVTLSDHEMALDPGAAAKLVCHVAVPETAAPGEYYAAVMVTLASKGMTEKGVSVQYRIASGLFVTVLGRTYPRQARITKCELDWPAPPDPATAPATATAPSPDAPPPADPLPTVNVVLENTGKARFDATGKLTVLDEHSRIMWVAPLETRRATVFGGDTRLFSTAIAKALTPGKYTFRVELDYQSGWGKAHQELPVEIQPEQAALLAQFRQHQHAAAAMLTATPDTLASALPAGATRVLAITVKNVSDADLDCHAAIAATAGDGAGVVVEPEQFTLARGARKSIQVRVQAAPAEPGAPAAGHLSAMVNIDADQEGAGHATLSIPVDIQETRER